MNRSESIGKLGAALAKVQIEIQDVFKGKSAYNYKYADLTSVLEIARPLCSKHEIAITQLCCNLELQPDIVGTETALIHSSGEWISSSLFMKVHESKGMTAAQASGSVITYARRYALAAILGISQTDNDASDHVEKVIEHVVETSPTHIALINLIAECKVADSEIKTWLAKAKVDSIAKFTDIQAAQCIAKLNARKNMQAPNLAPLTEPQDTK